MPGPPARGLIGLLGVLALLVSACGAPPVEVDANDPQTAMRLADQWVQGLPAYAATTRAPDAFVPALTEAGGDEKAVAVVRRAGSVGDGASRMQQGLQAWVERSLQTASRGTGLAGVREVGLSAARAQGHLQRAARALDEPITPIDDAAIRSLAREAGIVQTARLDALVATYTWALAPYATADGRAHTTAELRQALRAAPPVAGS